MVQREVGGFRTFSGSAPRSLSVCEWVALHSRCMVTPYVWFVTFRIEVEVEVRKQSDEAMHSCWDRGKLPPVRDSLVGHGFSRDLNGVIKRVPSNPPTWSTPGG